MVHTEELSLNCACRSPARLLTSADPSNALAMVYLTDPQSRRRDAVSEERARRLVACWNALIGLSTEDIEGMVADAKRKRNALDADESLATTSAVEAVQVSS